jgi:hypothetical protein
MQVYEVNFHGDRLLGVKTAAEITIPIKPICDALGIELSGQRQRILRHPVLQKSAGVITLNSGAAGSQQAVVLQLNRLNFWLATISPERIKGPGARERVILYQEECADALFDYFINGRATNPNFSATLLQSDLFGDEGVPPMPAAAPDAAPLATKADLEFMLAGLREAFLQVLRQIRNGDDLTGQSLQRIEGMVTGVEEMIMRLRRPILVGPRHPFDGPPNKTKH